MPAWVELANVAGQAVIITCAGAVIFVTAIVAWASARAGLALPFALLQLCRDWGLAARWKAEYYHARWRALQAGRGDAEPFEPTNDDLALALELLDDAIRVAGAESITIPRWQALNDSGRALRQWSARAWERATGLLGEHLIKTTGGGGNTVLRPSWRDLGTFARDVRAGVARLTPLPHSSGAVLDGGDVPGTSENDFDRQ